MPYQEYWDAYEHIMMEAGGRPHWAKVRAQQFNTLCGIKHKMGPFKFLILKYKTKLMKEKPK